MYLQPQCWEAETGGALKLTDSQPGRNSERQVQ